MTVVAAVFQAERDSERFALYAKKAALDERAAELRAQLKVTPCIDGYCDKLQFVRPTRDGIR